MSQPSLRVQPESSADPAVHCFRLEGIVDIDAVPVLEPLYALPAGIEAELDFAAVQRVNSMGLAQLLKLFEHWQSNAIRIRVSHANRMTSMLFRMTGLDRFLVTESPARATAAMPVQVRESASTARAVHASRVANPVSHSGPASPASSPAPPAGISPADPTPVVAGQTLEWRVHMQSTQQLNGWYFFNTHLQRRLSLPARLEFADNLLGSRENAPVPPDFVFTRPFDAVQLIADRGFLPLARPENQSDEVTILARAEDGRESLAEFGGSRVVAASRDSFVYLLGRYLLDESGVSSASMQYLFPGHEIKAVQMLLKGEADLLFMHSESYRRLSGMTRRMLKDLDRSEAQFAFHLWCLSPRREELAEPLRNFLQSMNGDGQGRSVLAELGCTAWVAPAAEDIEMLERIHVLYHGAD